MMNIRHGRVGYDMQDPDLQSVKTAASHARPRYRQRPSLSRTGSYRHHRSHSHQQRASARSDNQTMEHSPPLSALHQINQHQRPHPPYRRHTVSVYRPASWPSAAMPQNYICTPDCGVQVVHQPIWTWCPTQHYDEYDQPLSVAELPSQHYGAVPHGYETGWPMPSQMDVPISMSAPVPHTQQEPDQSMISYVGYCYPLNQECVALAPVDPRNSQVHELGDACLRPGHTTNMTRSHRTPVQDLMEDAIDARSTIKVEPRDGEQEPLIGLGLYDDSMPSSGSISRHQSSPFASAPVTSGGHSLLLGEGWDPQLMVKQEYEEIDYYPDDENYGFETSAQFPLNTGQVAEYYVQGDGVLANSNGYYYQPECYSSQSNVSLMSGGMGALIDPGAGWNMWAYSQQIYYGEYVYDRALQEGLTIVPVAGHMLTHQ